MKIPPFELERFFAEFEFSTEHLLCVSDTETFTVEQLLEGDSRALYQLLQLKLGYTETSGSYPLRWEISQLYRQVLPEEIMVFAGAQEALFTIFNCILQRGDHVLVQSPAYHSLLQVPQAIGCQVTPWKMHPERNWAPDLHFLEERIKPNTKAIVINSPHNPTGYCFTREELEQLVALADKHQLWLVSDEVYRHTTHPDSQISTSMADLYPRSVSVGVLSKAWGLAGLRIGWAATKDAGLFNSLANFKDYTTICNSAPSELLAILALRQRDKLLQRNQQILSQNLQLLNSFFAKYSDMLEWIAPTAGAVGFPRFSTSFFEENLYEEIRKEAGVLLAPGSLFDMPDSYFRLGFGRADFGKGLAAFDEFMQQKTVKSSSK
jgi:aspartate/methionine/tyrosine aminotransferase